ncbi:MAG: nitroreductase family protein [Candidatus Firestonebacteria bacterium]|nr:nitroreductase family protein [Candidatus Firestonebacteria bacterium]
MNPVMENIQQRRSVRLFELRPIAKNALERLLEAANQAPSGSNVQPWRFVVVESAEVRAKLATLALPLYQKWLASTPPEFRQRRALVDSKNTDPVYYSAPAIVFVIGKGGSGVLDCPMVCQNLMLAARSLEIGSCWVFIGSLVTANPEVKNLLQLAEGEKVYGPIVLGYPRDGFPEAPIKKAPLVNWL